MPGLVPGIHDFKCIGPKGVDGLNAGGWGVGLAISDNKVGVPLHEWNAMPEDIKQAHRDRIYPTTYQCGAH